MAKYELKHGDFRREFVQNPKAKKSMKKIEKYVSAMGFDVKDKHGIIDIVTPKKETLVVSMPKRNNGELKISCTKKNGAPCYKKVKYDGRDVKGGIIARVRNQNDRNNNMNQRQNGNRNNQNGDNVTGQQINQAI
jgi:hypothetical protein